MRCACTRRLILWLLLGFAAATSSHAFQRTLVATTGDDANNCTRGADALVGGLWIAESTVFGNGDGIVSDGATLVASENSIYDNAGYGMRTTGGLFYSAANNRVAGNVLGASAGAISAFAGL